MEPHKHRDLIIAWANGAEIQGLDNLDNRWKDMLFPLWRVGGLYRIKPREFKKGAFYPVRLNNNDHAVLVYDGESFIGDCYAHYPESAFSWIGEELSLGWPDQSIGRVAIFARKYFEESYECQHA